jgi:hypothetical protein
MIAFTNFLKAFEEAKFRESLKNEKDFKIDRRVALRQASLIAVIFSALTLEAVINDYGITNFSRSYFDNYLDKLGVVSKWVLIPKLVTGSQIDTGGQAFESLKWLFSLRDKYVHYKTIQVDSAAKHPKLIENFLLDEQHAANAIDAVKKVVGALAKLDNKVDSGWVLRIEKAFSA